MVRSTQKVQEEEDAATFFHIKRLHTSAEAVQTTTVVSSARNASRLQVMMDTTWRCTCLRVHRDAATVATKKLGTYR